MIKEHIQKQQRGERARGAYTRWSLMVTCCSRHRLVLFCELTYSTMRALYAEIMKAGWNQTIYAEDIKQEPELRCS